MQKRIVGWNILHGSAVMCITDIALAIHNTTQRHASQLEQIHFLPVHSGDSMICIRQANEGNVFIPPILFESGRRIRSHRNDLCATTGELLVFITQARQLRAAVRSHKPAQEREYDWFPITEA